MKKLRGNSFYFSNQGELADDKFAALPPGCVEAAGWLKKQLLLQKDRFTGLMEKYPDYSKDSGWLGGSGEDWERGPYYVRGLVSLAYVLNDQELKDRAQKWIDWAINSQDEEGFFGPRSNSDWWPRMPMLMAIREYYEATEREGKPDERVIPFMIKYFKYQLKKLPEKPLDSWAAARGGDNMDSVYWLYNRVYDPDKPQDSRWLLDLAELLKKQTLDWRHIFNESTARHHVVNTSQALKMPVLYYQQSKCEEDRKAFLNGLFNISIDHGRIDGLPNADEAARDNKSTRGTETCGVVEAMLSTEIAVRIFGEAEYADYLEKLAYNALPPCFAPDYQGHTYYILQNQVLASTGYHEFDCDHGDSSAFGGPSGFDCCFSNSHMGWPRFVRSMWMATSNNGLAIVAYGPNRVRARVAEGKMASFRQLTDYPFDETVLLEYEGEEADFSLMLRVPEWCREPVLKINGEPMPLPVKKGYFSLDRNWQPGDRLELFFPMRIETSTWYNNSVAVSRGPLVYSLKIREDYRILADDSTRELKVRDISPFASREIFPASRWNYALVADYDEPEKYFSVVKNEIKDQPFYYENAPVVLKAKGQVIPQWQLDGNIVAVQPYGPVEADEALWEDIELIPYACARLKITHFPKIKIGARHIFPFTRMDKREWLDQGIRVQEFRNVVGQPEKGHALAVYYRGKGRLKLYINYKYARDVDFGDQLVLVTGLDSLIGDDTFKFKNWYYNNIRFVGNDEVEIQGIALMPNAFEDRPEIERVEVVGNSIRIKTNVSRDYGLWRVVFGTSSGQYPFSARGFKGEEAVLSGLEAGRSYYVKLLAMVYGEEMESEEKEIYLPPGDRSEDVLKFNISAASAFELIQLKFPKIEGADSYMISYGREKGQYTDYIYDIIFNPYKGSHPFTADKTAFSVPGGATYYVKMAALKGTDIIAESEEIEIRVD